MATQTPTELQQATNPTATNIPEPRLQGYQPVQLNFPAPRTTAAGADKVFDDDWMKTTFIISDKDLTSSNTYASWIKKQRYRTSADDKFSCTAPGMSLGVNPKPQFTRYCDIRSKGRVSGRPDIVVGSQYHTSGLGMGGYYSRAIDDNQQRIFMRFGVPQYMPLPFWVYKAFDIHKTVLHGRGVMTQTFLQAVRVVSTFFSFAAAPVLNLAMAALDILVTNSRFYSVRPTMYTYWATVESILNLLVARRTMLPHILPDFTYKYNATVGNPPTISADFIRNLSAVGLQDIVNPETGRISVFAIALRFQAAYNKIKVDHLNADRNTASIDSATVTDNIQGSVTVNSTVASASTSGRQQTISEKLFLYAHEKLMGGEQVEGLDQNKQTPTSVVGYDDLYRDQNGNMLTMDIDPNNPVADPDGTVAANAKNPAMKDKWDKIGQYALAELTEGAAFAVFNVEHTGSVGESFSSSFGSNPIEATFNSLSAKTGAIGTMVTQAAGMVPGLDDALKLMGDTAATALASATAGLANPLLALAYGVNITMPKIWEQSSANLPSASYKMKLVSPYGNPYSQLFSLYLPFSMLAAGALPRSTGAASYLSPFFCQSYDRGRVNIGLGMIRNLNITRGTSNLSFTRAGHANAIDIEFEIANLDEIVAVDVTASGALTQALSVASTNFSDTPFINYLNTVAAVDVYTLVNRVPMARLKLAERMIKFKTLIDPDPAAVASATVNNFPPATWARNLLGDAANTLTQLQSF